MAALTTYDEDGLSVWSDLTYSEADTDEFGRRLLQHTRDAQRISNVLHGQPQAFRKAKPNHGIALTLDNLQRNGLAAEGQGAQNGAHSRNAPSVASSNSSDPPLNIPREWGRKGRHDHAWLRSIHRENVTLKAEREELIHSRNTAFTSDASPLRDGFGVGTHTLPATDQSGSPQRPPTRHGSTPPSARRHNDSLDRISEWEAEQSLDLTAASLLASTPALPSRNRRAIDDIRERELQSGGDDYQVAGRRAMWESTPSETRRRRFGDLFSETAHQNPVGSMPEGIVPSASGTRPFSYRRNNTGNKENVPLGAGDQNGAASMPSYKGGQVANVVDQASQASVTISPRRSQTQRRVDSMALLKRLARASSNSPSPTSAAKQASVLQEAQNLRNSTSSEHPVKVETIEPPVSARPHTTPQPERLGQTQHTSPAPVKKMEFPAQTPVVTGAWVDTPRTARRADDTKNTFSPQELSAEPPVPRRRSEPTLPTSALAAVLEGMRKQDKELDDDDPTLGDSTIASLEGIMNPAANEPTVTLNLPDSIVQDDTIDLRPTTQADRDRRQEDLALELLNSNLESARKSVHEARRGLKKAGRYCHPADISSIDLAEKYTEHKCDGHCDSCGRPMSVWRAAWSEYRSLYFLYDKRAKWGFRLTWFGLACVLFWTWLATESTLCSMYCHPTYAARMHDYGVNPDAPRFPFVIPALLFRPFRPLWRPLLSLLAWCFGELYFFLISSDDDALAGSSSSTPKSARVRIAGTAVLSPSSSSGSGIWSKVSWFGKPAGVGQAWSDDVAGEGTIQRMNIWDRGQKAWEAAADEQPAYVWDTEGDFGSESMGDDEYV